MEETSSKTTTRLVFNLNEAIEYFYYACDNEYSKKTIKLFLLKNLTSFYSYFNPHCSIDQKLFYLLKCIDKIDNVSEILNKVKLNRFRKKDIDFVIKHKLLPGDSRGVVCYQIYNELKVRKLKKALFYHCPLKYQQGYSSYKVMECYDGYKDKSKWELMFLYNYSHLSFLKDSKRTGFYEVANHNHKVTPDDEINLKEYKFKKRELDRYRSGSKIRFIQKNINKPATTEEKELINKINNDFLVSKNFLSNFRCAYNVRTGKRFELQDYLNRRFDGGFDPTDFIYPNPPSF